MLILIIVRHFGSDGGFGGRRVRAGRPCQYPRDVLIEEAEEVVLTAAHHRIVGVVSVHYLIAVLINEVEAHVALPVLVGTLSLGRTRCLDGRLAWLALRVADLDRTV